MEKKIVVGFILLVAIGAILLFPGESPSAPATGSYPLLFYQCKDVSGKIVEVGNNIQVGNESCSFTKESVPVSQGYFSDDGTSLQ